MCICLSVSVSSPWHWVRLPKWLQVGKQKQWMPLAVGDSHSDSDFKYLWVTHSTRAAPIMLFYALFLFLFSVSVSVAVAVSQSLINSGINYNTWYRRSITSPYKVNGCVATAVFGVPNHRQSITHITQVTSAGKGRGQRSASTRQW